MKNILSILILISSIYCSDFYKLELSNMNLDAYSFKYVVGRENSFNNNLRSLGFIGEKNAPPYTVTIGTGKEWCDKFCLNTTFDVGVGKNKIIEKKIWHALAMTNFSISIPIYTRNNYQFFVRPNFYVLVDSYDIGRMVSDDPSYKFDPFTDIGVGITIGFKFIPIQKNKYASKSYRWISSTDGRTERNSFSTCFGGERIQEDSVTSKGFIHINPAILFFCGVKMKVNQERTYTNPETTYTNPGCWNEVRLPSGYSFVPIIGHNNNFTIDAKQDTAYVVLSEDTDYRIPSPPYPKRETLPKYKVRIYRFEPIEEVIEVESDSDFIINYKAETTTIWNKK